MKAFFKIALIFFLFSETAPSQDTGSDIKVISNADPLLYNGKYYLLFYPAGTKGNQYLENNVFLPGSITLKGVVYNNLLINYDVFHQQLLLNYTENSGAVNCIIISDAWLESFSFSGLNFEVINGEGIKEIFQVIGKGTFRVIYKWRKEYNLDTSYGATNYVFSSLKRGMFLLKNGSKMKYWNNKSFLSLFNPEIKDDLKEYLKDQRINVRKADVRKIEALITFSNRFSKK